MKIAHQNMNSDQDLSMTLNSQLKTVGVLNKDQADLNKNGEQVEQQGGQIYFQTFQNKINQHIHQNQVTKQVQGGEIPIGFFSKHKKSLIILAALVSIFAMITGIVILTRSKNHSLILFTLQRPKRIIMQDGSIIELASLVLIKNKKYKIYRTQQKIEQRNGGRLLSQASVKTQYHVVFQQQEVVATLNDNSLTIHLKNFRLGADITGSNDSSQGVPTNQNSYKQYQQYIESIYERDNLHPQVKIQSNQYNTYIYNQQHNRYQFKQRDQGQSLSNNSRLLFEPKPPKVPKIVQEIKVLTPDLSKGSKIQKQKQSAKPVIGPKLEQKKGQTNAQNFQNKCFTNGKGQLICKAHSTEGNGRNLKQEQKKGQSWSFSISISFTKSK